MECRNSSLCIFDKPHTQTDIVKSYICDYHPITSLSSSGPIEFHIPGNTEDYIDVNDIYLHVKFKVKQADGTDIEAADKVGLNNLSIATLFQDVGLTLGEVQIEGGNQCYPYMAYLPTLLQMHPTALATHMKLFGWTKDEKGKFDEENNAGFIERQKWIQ